MTMYYAHRWTMRSHWGTWLWVLVSLAFLFASGYYMQQNRSLIIGVFVAFLALCSVIRSIVVNHAWALRIHDRQISWESPVSSGILNCDDLEAAHFDNSGVKETLYLRASNGAVSRIPYECFGKEEVVRAALAAQNPKLTITTNHDPPEHWVGWRIG